MSATPSDDLFCQAMKAWETAAEAGIKMQEECAKWAQQMFCQPAAMNNVFEKAQKAISETIAQSQTNVDEAIALLNRHAEASVKLIQKALEIQKSESPTDPAKLADWWKSAMDTMRINNQALLKSNSRILSTWSEVARKVNVEAAENMSDMAKKTSEYAEKIATASVDRFQNMAAQAAGPRA